MRPFKACFLLLAALLFVTEAAAWRTSAIETTAAPVAADAGQKRGNPLGRLASALKKRGERRKEKREEKRRRKLASRQKLKEPAASAAAAEEEDKQHFQFPRLSDSPPTVFVSAAAILVLIVATGLHRSGHGEGARNKDELSAKEARNTDAALEASKEKEKSATKNDAAGSRAVVAAAEGAMDLTAATDNETDDEHEGGGEPIATSSAVPSSILPPSSFSFDDDLSDLAPPSPQHRGIEEDAGGLAERIIRHEEEKKDDCCAAEAAAGFTKDDAGADASERPHLIGWTQSAEEENEEFLRVESEVSVLTPHERGELQSVKPEVTVGEDAADAEALAEEEDAALAYQLAQHESDVALHEALAEEARKAEEQWRGEDNLVLVDEEGEEGAGETAVELLATVATGDHKAIEGALDGHKKDTALAVDKEISDFDAVQDSDEGEGQDSDSDSDYDSDSDEEAHLALIAQLEAEAAARARDALEAIDRAEDAVDEIDERQSVGSESEKKRTATTRELRMSLRKSSSLLGPRPAEC